MIVRKISSKTQAMHGQMTDYTEAIRVLMEPSVPALAAGHGRGKGGEQKDELGAGLAETTDQDRFNQRADFFRKLCPPAIEHVPYFHVAGTNGKGSVCELLRSALSDQGQCVGTFTSPHVHTIRERIRVGDTLISKEQLVRHTAALAETFSKNPWLCFFDRLLAVALLHFEQANIETMILEVGIGGKYDSTNFLRQAALASVITSISFDHEELLGDTLEQIAEQKAGIIKPGSLVTCSAAMPAAVLHIIEQTVHQNAGKLVLVEPATEKHPHVPWVSPDNMDLAQAALVQVGVHAEHFDKAFWPCRFEKFLVAERRIPLVLDGAHNVDGVQKLLRRVNLCFPESQITVVFGAAADKSLACMLRQVDDAKVDLVLVRASHQRAASTEAMLDCLATTASERRSNILTCGQGTSVENGLQLALEKSDDHAAVIVCGSLYVAAQARRWLAREQSDLFSSRDWVFEADEEWS